MHSRALAHIFSSLNARFLFASLVLLPAFLGFTGFYLDKAFKVSLLAAEKARLQNNIYLLLSSADIPTKPIKKNEPATLDIPNELKDKDFERIDSGVYAYIFNDAKKIIWQSNSTSLQTPPTYEQISPKLQAGHSDQINFDFENSDYFIAYTDNFWVISKNREVPFRFVVVHDTEDFIAEVQAYRNQLWQYLGAAGILLLIAQTTILRWGFRPLKQLTFALNAMQSGETSQIEGKHPSELQDIVDSLNQVLHREQSLRQRYRNSLSDLAHSLKTPLAVIQANLGQSEDHEQLVAEQVARMNQVVTYQLQRAVASQQQGSQQRTAIEPTASRIIKALQKVYAQKNIQLDTHFEAGAIFAGDEQDLMEMLGNIIENAFKYGKSQIQIHCHSQTDQVIVTIGDDGNGIPSDKTSQILERGQRLDTRMPGQGIGLAVAADIIRSYQGALTINRSALGGAEFQISLPQAPVAI